MARMRVVLVPLVVIFTKSVTGIQFKNCFKLAPKCREVCGDEPTPIMSKTLP